MKAIGIFVVELLTATLIAAIIGMPFIFYFLQMKP